MRRGSLGINDEPKDSKYYKDSMEYIIESPIRCGFLLGFCESQFNVENLNFLIAVMRFRDQLYTDKTAWTKSWREIDQEMENQVFNISDGGPDESEDQWPSKRINKAAIVETMQKIVDEFIGDSAPYEICSSKQIQANTLRRVAMVDFYGPEVFTEATIDPLKTLKKDIMPRYIVSEQYMNMKARLESCVTLPTTSELTVPPPESRIIDTASIKDFPPERRFELTDILNCQILYTEFIIFLRKSVCNENLMCYQMIIKFEEAINTGQIEKAETYAWTIYRFFIASGSAYEISINYAQKRYLLLHMAIPTPTMFDEVKRSVMALLRTNFESFKATSTYEQLSSKLRSRIVSESMKKSAGSAFNCFG
mmetsp:Transcript_8327/g.8491  ORF Transcript_8327/g.8491 Transcript_8327/m.8491 type:complete len:365 (+) Transcript_8327:386-1480(+)